MRVDIVDNSGMAKREFEEACQRALEKCGEAAEGYAARLCPVDTGRLRGSISHTVSGGTAYVGTNVEYAAYVELGTGIHYPGGRQDPWIYQDENGDWHRTSGHKAQPFLKPAVAGHAAQYRGIIEDELKGG